MNFVRLSARLVQRGCSRVGALLSGSNMCLDADADQVGNYGAIIQFACNAGDHFQQWQPKVDPVAGWIVFQNAGATGL